MRGEELFVWGGLHPLVVLLLSFAVATLLLIGGARALDRLGPSPGTRVVIGIVLLGLAGAGVLLMIDGSRSPLLIALGAPLLGLGINQLAAPVRERHPASMWKVTRWFGLVGGVGLLLVTAWRGYAESGISGGMTPLVGGYMVWWVTRYWERGPQPRPVRPAASEGS